jgi:hypothetical protein
MKVVMNKLPAINMQVILNNFQYEIVTKEAPGLLFLLRKRDAAGHQCTISPRIKL